jgi:hypothetical protein
VLFRVQSCTIAGVVGFTSIIAFGDEVANWRDAATLSNPAREVIGQLVPTLATQPHGVLILASSARTTIDYHATAFAEGDTEHQLVEHAPTWIANPSLTEEQTKSLEPHPATWWMQFAAQPSDAITSITTAAAYDQCTSKGVQRRSAIPNARYLTFVDPGFRNDRFVVGSYHSEMREMGPDRVELVVVEDALTVLAPTFTQKVSVEEGIRAIVEHARAYPGRVYSDVHFFDALHPQLRERGVDFVEMKNTSPLISERIANLQVRFEAGTIALLDDEDARREMLTAQLQLHAHGRMTLRAPERRGAHDDTVSVRLLACDPDAVARLPPADGDVVVQHDAFWWDAEQHTLHGGRARYFRRGEGGRLTPREPPYGTEAFIEWAEELLGKGDTTPSIDRWRAENAQREANPGRPIWARVDE